MAPDSGPIHTTLFRPGDNVGAAVRSPRVAFHIDGEAYFDAFIRTCERAERQIIILAWDFDSRMVLRYKDDGTPDVTLGVFLNELCARKPDLRVYILDWDFPMAYGTDREYSPIFGLNWEPHRHIKFRFDDTHPLAGSHHQKIVVVDDKVAFAGGLDLTNKRWDSPRHGPDDKRRTFNDEPYPPFHDAMVMVDGDACLELSRIARYRWLAATHRKLPPCRPSRGDPWPAEIKSEMTDASVGVACTLPESGPHKATKHVESLYLDMIRRAKRYIYIENQYFTSDKVGEALKARLAEPDGPEIIVVTRLLSHGWLEENTMTVLRTKLVRMLREADVHKRFHAFYPHVEGLCDGTCLDLHSKVMIVDDEWARIGSSNLSNRSMGVDSECDVTIEAEGRPEQRKSIRAFRDRLVAEHAGIELARMTSLLASSPSIAAAIQAADSPKDRRFEVLETPEISEAKIAAAALGDLEKPISLEALMKGFAHDGAGKPARPAAKSEGIKLPWMMGGMIALVATLALVWRYTPLAEIVTADRVIALAETLSSHWWAPLLLILAYTPACLVMFPRPLITMAAVVVFGPVEGLMYSMTGVVLAGVAGYAIGRKVHRDTVRRMAGPKLGRLQSVLQKRGIIAVTLVRFVPIAPYAVVNIVMGAMRIKLWHFVLGTFLGMLPGAIAATVLSDQAASFLRDPARVNGWVIAGAVAAFAALAFAGHKLLSRMDAGGGPRAA
ncbi:MAG TPA: VTT domain-containing protein [Usitatibacter sp.]|nr:VTT domain-containing protein [Usitatibacter sp.]